MTNHWWHHDRTGDKQQVVSKGNITAEQQDATDLDARILSNIQASSVAPDSNTPENPHPDGLTIGVYENGEFRGVDCDFQTLKESYSKLSFQDFATQYLQPAFAQLFGEKEQSDAREIQGATPNDGDSGASSGEAVQAQSRSGGNDASTTPRVCSDEGKEAAPTQEGQPPASQV